MEPSREQEPSPRLPRVLIVEDEGTVEDLLRAVFEGEVDVEAKSFPKGEDAITMLEKRGDSEPIDVLITDLGLNDGPESGFNVAEVFKKKYPNAKIIFLTGSAYKVTEKYTPEQRKALNMKVVSKPCSPMALLAMVKPPTVTHAT
ncbi:MAG: response regulator [Candidatus Levybacteria bacterium]|nr:response regulator [Candidatus Levybacteria bacterium]